MVFRSDQIVASKARQCQWHRGGIKTRREGNVKDRAKIISGLSIAAVVWFALPKFSSTAPVSGTAGWNDLILCSELISFDGRKTLSLFRNGTVRLDDNSGPKRPSEKGTWESGNRPKAYDINFDDRSLHLERVAPDGWESCMLVAGTSVSANLQLSWFAVEPKPERP
jgi:hypothetical protein